MNSQNSALLHGASFIHILCLQYMYILYSTWAVYCLVMLFHFFMYLYCTYTVQVFAIRRLIPFVEESGAIGLMILMWTNYINPLHLSDYLMHFRCGDFS
jgi:hypothetical protein